MPDYLWLSTFVLFEILGFNGYLLMIESSCYVSEYLKSMDFYLVRNMDNLLRRQIVALNNHLDDLNDNELFFLNHCEIILMLREDRVDDAKKMIEKIILNNCNHHWLTLFDCLENCQPIIIDDIVNKSFFFKRIDSDQLIAKIILKSDGSISGISHPNENSWSISSSGLSLEFKDKKGLPTTAFFMTNDRYLNGPFLRGRCFHYLEKA